MKLTFPFCLRYKIRGNDDEWDHVLKKAGNTAVVSIKRYVGFKSCFEHISAVQM